MKNAHQCVVLLDHILDKCVEPGIKIPSDLRTLACKNAIAHHHEHISFCRISQTTLDAYKFLSWYGWALLELTVPLETEKAKKVVTSTIQALNLLLRREAHRRDSGLNLNSQKLLRKLLMNEWGGASGHGIGKNGLYVAFHCAASPLVNVH